MKARVYFNYLSCVVRDIEVEKEDDIWEKIESMRCEITDEEIRDSIQEANVDYDVIAEAMCNTSKENMI